MKFVVIYRQRTADPVAAQRQAGRLLTARAIPPGLKVHQLLSSIGEGGGYAVVETADAMILQQFAGLFSAYECRIHPVVDLSFAAATGAPAPTVTEAPHHARLPEMPPTEPHEGAFSDDDIYDTED